MKFEVEQKFPVADLAAIERQLTALGAEIKESRTERDTYFAHPARDFAQTDEALRIRSIDQENFVTYKGPKVDKTTKTRHEIELPLAAGAEHARQFAELLHALGFRPVTEVVKQRRKALLNWEDRDVEAALDEVQGVGTFVELEIAAGADGVDSAREALVSLAARLGLQQSERRSYLELLLERQAAVRG